jgi:sugar phosphate isomerase/epimerase
LDSAILILAERRFAIGLNRSRPGRIRPVSPPKAGGKPPLRSQNENRWGWIAGIPTRDNLGRWLILSRKTSLMNPTFTRRQFLQRAAVGTVLVAAPRVSPASTGKGVNWPIGCFNRPWSNWSYDQALDGLRTAGFKTTGLVGSHYREPLLSLEATPEYIDTLRGRIAERGLTPLTAWLRSRHNTPVEESIRTTRELIDQAARLGLKYLLSGGTSREEQFDNYWRTMADASAYAEQKGIQMTLKPHGGASGAAAEVQRCLEEINHPNFKVWYDAGNIIHYTGRDPVAELESIAQYVTGFCAKDCAEVKGGVMMQFGDGKVDFAAVFRKLKAAGFNGPVMIECTAPATRLEEVTAHAIANRQYLERILASL